MILQRGIVWRVILAVIFSAALAALGYILLQPQPPAPAGYLAADKGYGVTIDLAAADPATLDATLAALRANRLLWLRLPIRWSDLEPAPGQFDWTRLDNTLAALARQPASPPFKLIAVLQDSPVWARLPHRPASTPPQQQADFGRFARAFAARYGAQVDYYQIWHEPNLSAGWGNAYIDPVAYAGLLREAALNIRAADPTAFILTAALAPTRENGSLNLNEMDFLDQLYQANAAGWFDIVAGQPYGFDFAADSPPHPDRLNFRRLELLRQVMLAHGDADTPVWATAAGWNALPADWAGQPSPWRDDQTRTDSPAVQAQRTAVGLSFARQNWPWLGPLLAVRWDDSGLAADDPARGFALAGSSLLEPFRAAAALETVAAPGRYPAAHPSGQTSPGWRSALTLADVPRNSPRQLVITFEGSRLDVAVNRGAYRGYLWVTVDGQPANALPVDGQGRSYVSLYDPLCQPATVTLARRLPPGRHQAVVEADGGWEQWPVAGWTVSNDTRWPAVQAGLLLAALLLALSGAGLAWQFWPAAVRLAGRVGGWRQFIPGEGAQVAVIFSLVLAVYFAPGWLALALLPPLALALVARPDVGLALLALGLSFFQAPRLLPLGLIISPTETPLLLAATGVALRAGWRWRRGQLRPPQLDWAGLDGAALALLGVGLLSTLAAPNFGINFFNWRVLLFGPVVYYVLVRAGLDYGPAAGADERRWVWRLVDALAAGVVLHAGLGVWGYFFAGWFVPVDGVARALGPVYASPNNLALLLGRVLPILLAVAVLPGSARWRRWLYGVGLLLVGLALALTYSRGALLLGLPAAVLVMAGMRGWSRHRRALLPALAGLLAAVILLPIGLALRGQAVALFAPGSTAFFRLKLWQSTLIMLRDYWPLGIGPGNFLYLYRTIYILPAAWQEPNLSHPHNIILDFAVRLGVGGIAALGWLQLAFWRQAWRLYGRWPAPLVLGLMGSMAAAVSHGLLDNSYFLVDLAFVFFLTLGLVQGCSRLPELPKG